MRAKTLFALLFLLELGWSAYYCADTGLYYSADAFCDAVCGSPCQTLIANPQGLPCDDTNYELFIYNPQTKKTIAITKERGRWEDFTNLLVVEDANDNEGGRQVLSYLGARAWIGMYDPELSPSYNSINPDRFVWWDGTAVSYTNWAEGEPDNRVEGAGGEPPLGEHWAFMKTDGTWGDGDKDTRLRALVMWRKRLDCVNGLPESDRTGVDDMINLYCGGETPCFLCTDGEEIDRCSLGEAFSGTVELSGGEVSLPHPLEGEVKVFAGGTIDYCGGECPLSGSEALVRWVVFKDTNGELYWLGEDHSPACLGNRVPVPLSYTRNPDGSV
ncbi:MAG TPA: hypothetical protein EYP11_02760, partial [Aquificaceae bacterium]|nr:hypothetical protein [Aquificaceae bacterium]